MNGKDAREDGDAGVVQREHTRELQSASSFMGLAEHLTWELGEAVDGVDYPIEVTVSIKAEEVADER